MTSFYKENSETRTGDAFEGVATQSNTSLATVEEMSAFWPKIACANKQAKHLYGKKYKRYLAEQRWSSYTLQSGVKDVVDKAKLYITQLQAVKSLPIPVDVFYHMEGAIALYFALIKSKDLSQIGAIIYLYCTRYYSKSITTLVMDLVNDMLISNQSGDSNSEPTLVRLMKQAKDNWKLVLNSEGVINISKIMSILLSLGLCDSSQINFSIAGVRLFAFNAYKRQCSAVDLIDAVFSTICYFVEGGYECFKTGSISPLLCGDIDISKLEQEIAECERLSEYAKTGDLRKRANMEVNDYDTKLRNVIDKLQVTVKTTSVDYIRKILTDKLEKLRKIQTLFFQTRVQGGLRESPYGMAIYGSSGVGKSCVSNLLMTTVLTFNGYSAADECLLTINDKDKFMSNMRSNINGIYMDDVGNTKADFVETAPTSRIIEIINNVRAYANMADLDMKGKVSIEPKVVNITTNVKDMCSTQYSNEPASIARRAQFIVTVTVKPEFCTNGMLDYIKVQNFYTGDIPLIPDLWNIKLEKAFPVPNATPGRPDEIGYQEINFTNSKGEYCWGDCISIFDLIDYACDDSKKYFNNQRSFVENSNNLAEKLDFCVDCRKPQCMCVCTQNQAGYVLFKTVQHLRNKYVHTAINKYHSSLDYIEKKSAEALLERLKFLETSPYTSWTNYIPSQYLDHPYIKTLIYCYSESELKRNIMCIYMNCILLMGIITFFSFYFSPYLWFLLVIPLRTVATAVHCEKSRVYARIKAENENMPQIFKQYRDSYITYICGISMTVSAVYVLVKAWQFAKWSVNDAQGNINPTSIDDILERDNEAELEQQIAKEHNWDTVKISRLPCNKVQATTTHKQCVEKIYSNLCFMYYMKDDKMYACNILFIKSNIALIPHHFLDSQIVTILRRSKGTVGSNFKAQLSKEWSYHIPNTDLCLVYVTSGGSWKDLTSYFPISPIHNCPATLIYKKLVNNTTIERLEDRTFLNFKEVGNQARMFQGCSYSLNINTFVGLCMGVLVSDTKPSMIAGLHLGGVSGTPQGVAGYLSSAQLSDAINFLNKKPGVLVGASEGTFRRELYDVQIMKEPIIHEKSPVRKISPDSCLEVYGSCPGRATYYSSVEESKIATKVTEICGVPQKFGKPKFHLGKAWLEALTLSSNPSIGIEGELLSRAVIDYQQHLLEKFKRIPELSAHVQPLSQMETVCGIDGLRFIDKMPLDTSVGAPLSGPKAEYITRLESEEYPDFACPASLDQKFWDEFEYCKGEFLQGRRVYFTFKACLKDEPTELTKDKVRVFHAAPIVLQLFTRMYYLPIVRLLSLFPLDSECAVGINTVGPEFNTLIEFMRKFGDKRILAGDYNRYDTRMPAQLMYAAFDILLTIAEHYGYSDDDIQIMKCIATEICNPLMMYNGDLVQHVGSNPSGQNLTVYINSIVNSLLMRSCFFSIYPNAKSFRDGVAMMTYGDDAKGSVHEKYDDFNHLSYADFLRQRDIIFTMPDKNSTPTKYMDEADADFLKRKSVYNTALNQWMGALDEGSIFKSLMCNLESKALSKTELAVETIDGAIREWFFHGPDVYDFRRNQMKKIANDCNLTGCTMLSKPYKTALEEYCVRYKIPLPDLESL